MGQEGGLCYEPKVCRNGTGWSMGVLFEWGLLKSPGLSMILRCSKSNDLDDENIHKICVYTYIYIYIYIYICILCIYIYIYIYVGCNGI